MTERGLDVDLLDRLYRFLFPIELRGFGKVESLSRIVVCRGLKPRVLIDPQVLDFGRKIIVAPDKSAIGKQANVTLSNPDKFPMKWRVDLGVFGASRIFDVLPDSGEIPPGESKNIVVAFNPYEPGIFEHSIPLYVDDPAAKSTASYIDI